VATGNTLAIFKPQDNEPPATNFATLDLRNLHPVLNFDTTTAEAAVFSFVLPRLYAGGGITVYVTWMAATATTGTIGWTVEFERVGVAQDTDSDSFAGVQTITAATVSGTSGIPTTTNVVVTNGANIDSLTTGEVGRIRIKRDVTNDTATGDAQILAVELKET
jgi:hypothetical protein